MGFIQPESLATRSTNDHGHDKSLSTFDVYDFICLYQFGEKIVGLPFSESLFLIVGFIFLCVHLYELKSWQDESHEDLLNEIGSE